MRNVLIKEYELTVISVTTTLFWTFFLPCCIIFSVAILRYLCREHSVDDHWYPKDSKAQARVDEYLEWQHLNTRLFCAMYFQHKVAQQAFVTVEAQLVFYFLIFPWMFSMINLELLLLQLFALFPV